MTDAGFLGSRVSTFRVPRDVEDMPAIQLHCLTERFTPVSLCKDVAIQSGVNSERQTMQLFLSTKQAHGSLDPRPGLYERNSSNVKGDLPSRSS